MSCDRHLRHCRTEHPRCSHPKRAQSRGPCRAGVGKMFRRKTAAREKAPKDSFTDHHAELLSMLLRQVVDAFSSDID